MINKLQIINLTPREAEVYVALLQKKEFTAPELTKITNVTRTKIYEILQNLINKGACIETYKNGQKIFQGIEPKIALQNIMANFEKEFNQKKQALLEQMKQASGLLERELAEIYLNNKLNTETIDFIEILSNENQITTRWFNLLENVKNEILVFTKPPYVSKPGDNKSVVEEAVAKRKISAKSIYEYSEFKHLPELREEFTNMVVSYQSTGEETRIIDKLPMKLVIIDEKITMLALKDLVSLKPSVTTVIITHPDFAIAQKEVFNSYWEKSLTFEEFQNLKN